MTEKIEEAVLETGEYSVAVASVSSTGSSSSSSTITDEGVLPDVGDTDTGNEGNTSEGEEDGVYEEPSGGSTGNNSSASSIMSSCLETCIIEDENAEAQPETPVSTVPGSSVADPVDAYSGAHTIKNNVLSLFGGQNISLNVSYNSSKLLRGVFGVGWYHNYEKRISLYGSGYKVYDNPGTYCLYTACSCSNVYTTESSTKHGYTLTVTEDAEYPYCINCNSEKFEYYNSDGLLAKIVSHQGFETVITYSDELITITDKVTNKSLYLEKDSTGKVVRVYDATGRSTTIYYHCNYIKCILDPNKNGLVYSYYSNGKIQSGTDSKNIRYFWNTYDEYGRVAYQSDAESVNSTKFEYSGNTRTVTNRNGDTSKRIFNEQGLLVEFEDENCNTKSYEYDDYCNVKKETDGNGNSVYATYNSFNKPITVTDKRGKVTSYEYDTNGNVTKITYPNNAFETYEYNERNQVVKHTDLRGTVTVYTYDTNGLPASKKVGSKAAHTYTYENGLLVSEKDPLGNETKYEYESNGLVNKKIIVLAYAEDGEDVKSSYDTVYEYDSTGNVTKITDANGKTVEYTYDANYQKVSVKDANGNVTQYTYNGNMKPVKTTYVDGSYVENTYDDEDRVISVKERNTAESKMTYDKGGRLTKKVLPDGAETSYVYDGAGHVLTETNHYGAVVTKTYDANGNVLTSSVKESETADSITTTYTYDCMSRVATKEIPAGAKTTYTYNNAGDLLSESTELNDSTNIVKSYEYDAYGNKIKFTDPNGNITRYTYDDNNNLLSVKVYTETGNDSDTAPYVQTVYEYDARNLLVKVTDARNNSIRYEYDALGRKIKTIDARGNHSHTEYDPNGNVLKVTDFSSEHIELSASEYDKMNQVTSVKDATDNITKYTYNIYGQLTGITDPFEKTHTYGYDVMGRNVLVTDSNNKNSKATYDHLGNISSIEGPLGSKTEYTYDNIGRLTSETVVGGTREYTYNAQGLKESFKNARGNLRTFFYDTLGRITGYTVKESEGSQTYADTASFVYDNNGNVLTASDSKGTVTRTFDALNRVTSYTDTLGNTIGYEYDCVGNLIKLTYPGSSEKFVTYEYDQNNNLVKVTGWGGREITYTYDANNRVTGVTKPDGSETETTYDAAGRVVRTEDFFRIDENTTTTISGFEYVYDKLGRISSESDLANDLKLCYTYDTLSRVTARTTIKPADSETVTNVEYFYYDAAGNVTQPRAVVAYDANNRFTLFNGNAVTYDADGNMTGSSLGALEYDFANRLVRANEYEYTYDVENIRTKKSYGETVTTYTHNANSKLSQLLMKTENGVTTYYIYGLGLIYETTETDCKVYHYDYRGSTVALTNLQGSVTDTFTYDTYGKLTTRTGSTATPFLYNGRDGVMTDENGLVYMRARYYSPTFKRFINADVVAGSITNAITLNRYAYANGNPVSNVDPFGLSAERGAQLYEQDDSDDIVVIQEPTQGYVEDETEVTVDDKEGFKLPNWAKWVIGGTVIVGLGVAAALTGGTIGVIAGAALSGALSGGAIGTISGAIFGGISGGWRGALDGASSGFMSGVIFGSATGAISSGLNIARGVTTVIGKPHASLLHKLATNMEAGKMAITGKYSQIGLNRSLKTMGLNGTLRPDAIGISKNGLHKLIEVVSPKQSTSQVINKMDSMLTTSNATGKVIKWVRNIFKLIK